MANKLSTGTRFRLLGSNESDAILVLASDAKIEEVSDQAMVGSLIDDQKNYQLNIGNVPGTWNPVTGAAEPPDTNEPAVAMPEEAEEPKEKKPTASKKVAKKKASKKKA